MELEMGPEEFLDLVVLRRIVEIQPEEGGAGQGGVDVLGRRGRVAVILAQRPSQHSLSLTAGMRGRVDVGVPAQPKRAGSKLRGSGGSSPGSSWPAMAWARARAE